MSYNDALRTAIANELCRRQTRDARGHMPPPVHPNDIMDIELHWDNGDRPDPTYGGTTVEPTLEVRVTYNCQVFHGKWQPRYETVSVELVFTALLRAVLETGL
jgi:hypothetical protein